MHFQFNEWFWIELNSIRIFLNLLETFIIILRRNIETDKKYLLCRPMENIQNNFLWNVQFIWEISFASSTRMKTVFTSVNKCIWFLFSISGTFSHAYTLLPIPTQVSVHGELTTNACIHWLASQVPVYSRDIHSINLEKGPEETVSCGTHR